MTARKAPEIFVGAFTRVRGKEGMVGVRKEEWGGVEWGAKERDERGTER